MNSKFIRCVSLIFLVVFAFTVSTSAAGLNIVVERSGSVDNVNQSLVVTGKINEFTSGEAVSLKVFNKGANENSLSFDDYKYIGQTAINADGSFKFVFDFKEQGDFSLIATSYKEKISGEKYISDLTAISQLITGLNDGSITASDAQTMVETNNKELLFDNTIYKDFSGATKLLIWQNAISENKPNFSIDNIYSTFDKYTILDGINKASSSDAVKKIIEYYNDKYLKLEELNIEVVKKTFTATELLFMYDLMKNQNLTDFNSLKTRYVEAVILSKYKNISNYQNIAGLLSDCKTEIDIINEVAQYDNLEDAEKKAFCLYLSDERNNVTSIADDETAGLKGKVKYALENIQSLVEKYSTPLNNGGGGGAVGGGGAGGAGAGDVTISDDYIPENEAQDFEYAISLSDVNDVSWAAKEINALYEKGIINGKAPGEYKPYDNVTRAEITKMISVAFNVYDENAESDFNDAKNHWAYRYISSAANKGYILGMNETEFGVDKPITRQDTAVILYRIIQYSAKSQKIIDITKSFTDSEKISDYARNSVIMLAEYGILNGFDDGSFKPQETLNRAQAAVVIYNLLEFMNE